MNATTGTLQHSATRRGSLTFVGFATWLDDDTTGTGDIELWCDQAGKLFAWSTNAVGQTSVRLVS